MAFDFPNSPTVGQQFTPVAGTTYTWNGYGWVLAGGTSSTADIIPACGRLAYSSATLLIFIPFNGDRIKINGAIYPIPSAGIAGLANTSVFVNGTAGQNLAASTTYYVYAFNNSGTVTADFSTTGHSTSFTAGNAGTEIKTGDDTRTLIGMVRTNASSQFVDSGSQRFVLSWLNRRRKISRYFEIVSRGVNSGGLGTIVEVNSAIRNEFLCWADDTPDLRCLTSGQMGTTGYAIGLAVGYDGTVPSSVVVHHAPASGYYAPFNVALNLVGISEGYHYGQVFASSTTGGSGGIGGGPPIGTTLDASVLG